jgi:hypothetical protein
MKFITDHFYCIGSSHQTCQDRADSFCSSDRANITIADGCSMAKDSDIGATILTKVTKKFLSFFPPTTHLDFNADPILDCANISRLHLGLNRECLRSTLLLVYTTKKGFCVKAYGDGIIVVDSIEQGLGFININFPSNAPYYPIYDYFPTDKKDYFSEFENKQEININIHEKDFSYESDIEQPQTFVFPFNQYKTIGIMSDGATTFYTEDNKVKTSVKLLDVVKEMFAFKNLNPNFVKRRCQKALKKYKHYDDFSIGVIHAIND